MAETPLSREKFLKSLGKSVTSMALGTGMTTAAQTLADRIASATETSPPSTVKENTAKDDIPFIESGPPESNRVALTFDDGPTPGVTDRILDELKQRNLPATFFMIGQRISAAPELARRVLAEGHEIGNHTLTHPKLSTLPDPQVDFEIQKTQDILGEILEYRPVCFRPPYGAFRKNQAGIPHGKGLAIIFWNVNPADWSQPGETQILDAIMSQTKPGSIIGCHDMHPQTANCLGRILDGLLERHFTLVTISSLLGLPQPKQMA